MRPCSLRIQTIVSNRTFALSPAAYQVCTWQIGNPAGIGYSDRCPGPIGNDVAGRNVPRALSQMEIQPRTIRVLLRVLPVSA
jgi:hypothetical protein